MLLSYGIALKFINSLGVLLEVLELEFALDGVVGMDKEESLGLGLVGIRTDVELLLCIVEDLLDFLKSFQGPLIEEECVECVSEGELAS